MLRGMPRRDGVLVFHVLQGMLGMYIGNGNLLLDFCYINIVYLPSGIKGFDGFVKVRYLCYAQFLRICGLRLVNIHVRQVRCILRNLAILDHELFTNPSGRDFYGYIRFDPRQYGKRRVGASCETLIGIERCASFVSTSYG